MNAPASPILALNAAFSAQRAAYAAEPNPSEPVRRERVKRLISLLEENEKAFADAISADFGHRSPSETKMAEVFVSVASMRHTARHIGRWMRKKRISTALHFAPGQNRLIRQPLGVVGVVSAWNYPVQLALVPASAALAAGNRVMIKPSEQTPATSALLARLIGERFDAGELVVIEGDATVGQAFVELPFNHLLFTGSTAVGRLVAQAAAKNLTPVTLELGGKSPVIIDASADISQVLDSLMFGKLLNAGQTCIAPDYVLLPAALESQFLKEADAAVRRLYPMFSGNPDYTAIVNPRHEARINHLVEDAAAKGAHVVGLGEAGAKETQRRMQPRLVLNVSDDMALMQEEIFGPVLPVVRYGSRAEAIDYVNHRPRPLALYWYGKDKVARDEVLERTVSGGVTVNDTLWHMAQEDQPFGGVGSSGYGAYHGEFGFRTFTREKPVFYQSRLNGAFLLRPPYGARFTAVLNLIKKIA
jgi:coniferyl-aldehyde dehydrogenase